MLIGGHRSLTSSSLWVATRAQLFESVSSMECWNPGGHGCLRTHPAKLDAGHPCRHDDLHFHFSVGERKIMNHFVVYSLAASIYFWSLVRADLPVDAMPATPLHRRFLAGSWAGQKYSRASQACPDLTVQR